MKLKKILILMFLILLTITILYTTKVYAVNSNLTLQGADKVEVGGSGTAYLKISSDIDVGAITLTIATTNMKNITCTGENGWVIQAQNNDKGIYQLVKASAGKEENVLKIDYTILEDVQEGEIIVKDISAATTEFEDFEMDNTSKKITVEIKNEEPEKEPEKEPENNTVVEKKEEQKNTQANKAYNHTGLKELGFVVIAVIGITAISYIGYKRYKNI